MINAKDEFIAHTAETNSNVLCATLVREVFDSEECEYVDVQYTLPENYTPDEYSVFIESLNFEYDDGFGCQEITGVILYTNGTWSERGEYDGSEWWEYKKCPEIPEKCRR